MSSGDRDGTYGPYVQKTVRPGLKLGNVVGLYSSLPRKLVDFVYVMSWVIFPHLLLVSPVFLRRGAGPTFK